MIFILVLIRIFSLVRADAGMPPACKAGSLTTTFALNVSFEFVGISVNVTTLRLNPVWVIARGVNVTYALGQLTGSRAIGASEDVTNVYSRISVRNAVHHSTGDSIANTAVDTFEVVQREKIVVFSGVNSLHCD
jgi:hypothetical protein